VGAILVGRLRWAPIGLAVTAALVVPMAHIVDRPALAWVGVALVLAAAVVDAAATRREASPSG
jgi:hypothetical protein